jgi:hypothetical protein
MAKQINEFESTTIISRGGWDANRNWLELSETGVGVAAELINYEPSLFGGYRRINGFEYLETTDSGAVDPSGAEGKILGVFIYDDQILCARKQQGSAIYSFYKYVDGASWSEYVTGLTHVSTGVNRIRYATFNFDGNPSIIFVDGVNKATIFNGTTWTQIDSADTGLDYANAGGPQAINAPSCVSVFENHIFLSGDANEPHIVAHSAPNAEYDWLVANGAGQLFSSMDVNQLAPFRDRLYVFSTEEIDRIYVEGANFVIKDVTKRVGCIAPDSIIEINGDLVFLAEDGFRPIAATERIDDVELATISKKIQSEVRSVIRSTAGSDIVAIPVPSKSQFRCFFASSSAVETTAPGFIAGLVQRNNGVDWEWGKLQGIKVACATHGHFGTTGFETIIHGTFDGKVMIQETGNSFNGSDIYSRYTTPYIDLQAPNIRKTLHEIMLFLRAEGDATIYLGIKYDWGLSDRINPVDFDLSSEATVGSLYGIAVYGTDVYSSTSTNPLVVSNIQGSGKSFNLTYVNTSTEPSWTIMGQVIKYKAHGYS